MSVIHEIRVRKIAFSHQLSASHEQQITINESPIQNFRNIQVWQKAHELTLQVYKATKTFPKEEIYGLTSQMRRAALSIPCNIAEGCARSTDADFARFLDIAIGSASEVECQLLLARDLRGLREN